MESWGFRFFSGQTSHLYDVGWSHTSPLASIYYRSVVRKSKKNKIYCFFKARHKLLTCRWNKLIEQKSRHLHQNEAEEGLVFCAEDFRYSSASDYTGDNEMLNIAGIESWYGQKRWNNY